MSTPDSSTKQKIIEAMYHLIAEYGYDKASMSKLCEAVGITKPSIYYYFQSKEDILFAVHDEIHIAIDNNDDICVTTSPDEYRKQLLSLGARSIAAFHDDAERHRVLAEIDLQSTRIPALASHRTSVAQKTSRFYKNILQHGIELGVLTPDFDIETAAQFFYTLMAGMSQTVANKDDIDEKAIWDWFIQELLFANDTHEDLSLT